MTLSDNRERFPENLDRISENPGSFSEKSERFQIIPGVLQRIVRVFREK